MEQYSRAFKDINLSFKSHPVTKDILSLSNEEAIKRSVKNIVFTLIGEKIFNPSFGSNIRDYVFELDTNISPVVIENEIKTTVSNFEPRIENLDVKDIVIDDNELSINIAYDIVGFPIPTTTIEFVLSPTRV